MNKPDYSRSLPDRFKEHPFYNRLDKRQAGFDVCMEHLERRPWSKIIETGCAWFENGWEGHGQSTLIWDWVLHNRPNMSCDSYEINPKSIEKARAQISTPIRFIEGDSIQRLNEWDAEYFEGVSLVYLDSFDWTPELQMDSAFHHMSELTAMWCHLTPGTMIMVDDRHSRFEGKHLMVQFFFEKLGYKPVYEGYQIAWIK